MGIKDFAIQVKLTVDQDAQIKYIDEICADEGVDFRTAELMAKGLSDPKRPDLTVGYKLVGSWAALIFQSKLKLERDKARFQFMELLDDAEKRVFEDNYPDSLHDEYMQQYKKEKRKAKKQKKGL